MQTDNSIWQTIIPGIVTGIITGIVTGIIVGTITSYLAYKYRIKNENVGVIRDRLLRNINKIEDQINMLIELSEINQDISRLEDIDHSIDETIFTLNSESGLIDNEISLISTELENNQVDSAKLKELLSRLDNLNSQNIKIKNTLADLKSRPPQITEGIGKLHQQLDDKKNRVIKNDIDATLQSVDRSGLLAKYFSELMSIFHDPNKNFTSDPRALEIRVEISNHFEKLINEFG